MPAFCNLGMLSSEPFLRRLSRTMTSDVGEWPLIPRAREEPTKPAPPVMRTRFITVRSPGTAARVFDEGLNLGGSGEVDWGLTDLV